MDQEMVIINGKKRREKKIPTGLAIMLLFK